MGKEENITKISDMLMQEGKVLSTHCPSCGSPLFKINDVIVCPICETRFIEEKNLKKSKNDDKQDVYK